MGRKGLALVITLIITALLVMMLTSLLVLNRDQGTLARHYSNAVAATYAAEAGVAATLEQLRNDPNWVTGFQQVPLTETGATYSVTFNTRGAPFSSIDSINNLTNSLPTDGPLDVDVPGNSALIVVVGRQGLTEKRIEVLIQGGTAPSGEGAAVTASGRILLEGNVVINGLNSLAGADPLEVVIHSNKQDGGGEPTVQWRPTEPDDGISVRGTVSAFYDDVNAIDLGSDPTRSLVDSTQTNAGNRPHQVVDIPGRVSAKTGATAPNLPLVGSATLASGDYHIAQPQVEMNGDLELDGADLYVDGDLIINGAIRGKGAVYVTGNTYFRGDASLVASQQVSLFSQGNVTLEGFDGRAYLNSVANGNGDFKRLLDNSERLISEAVTVLEGARDGNGATDFMGNQGFLDKVGHTLGNSAPHQPPTLPDENGVLLPNNTIGLMAQTLESDYPASPTRDFLMKKLETYRQVFHHDPAVPQLQRDVALPTFEANPGPVPGIANSISDAPLHQVEQLFPLFLNELYNIDYDRLGTAYFQGQIYTNGYLYANKDVTIKGTLVLHDNGANPSDVPSNPDPSDPSIELYPGDLMLRGGSSITYIEEYLEESQTTVTPVGFSVKTWAGR